MICPFCKKQVPDGTLFCPECGQNVSLKPTTDSTSSAYWTSVDLQNETITHLKRESESKIATQVWHARRNFIVGCLLLTVILVVVAYFVILKPNQTYREAMELLNSEDYEEAIEIFSKLNGFRDSSEKILECKYSLAVRAYNSENYYDALERFQEIRDYSDSASYLDRCDTRIVELKYEAIIGTYTGCYSAGQGETGLTLTIYAEGSSAKATFEFYNLPGKDNAESGSYTMAVHVQDDEYVLEGEEWINQPSSYSMLDLKGKLYGDTFCGHDSIPFVVSKDVPQPSKETPSFPNDAIEWGGHHYYCYSFSDLSCWEEAEAYCEQLGGYLAVISSEEENREFFSIMNNYGYESAYFGYTDNLCETSWYWVNGENSSYENWHSDEPNAQSQSEDYAMFYYKFDDGTWNDGTWDDNGVAFLCEWE